MRYNVIEEEMTPILRRDAGRVPAEASSVSASASASSASASAPSTSPAASTDASAPTVPAAAPQPAEAPFTDIDVTRRRPADIDTEDSEFNSL